MIFLWLLQAVETTDEPVPATTSEVTESETSDDDDFEIINAPPKEDSRTLALLDNFGKMPREKGLDQQSFECAGCKCSIGLSIIRKEL